MKSHLSRIISIILALSLVVCSFASCQQIQIEEEPSTEKPVVNAPSDVELPVDDNNGGTNNGGTNNGGTNNGGTSNGGTNNGGTNNGGSNNGGTNNGGTNNGGSNNGGSMNQGDLNMMFPTIDWEQTGKDMDEVADELYTYVDTPEERIEILRDFGYEYDAEQDIYYTHLNPWQRYFGFADIYDQTAPITMMFYLTLKIDFDYKDLHWRLQWWKGQYGILEGAELGVYTKKFGNEDMPFYKCAEDEHLLRMEFEYYESASDYNNGNMLFIRQEQEHWWLTGFKFGNTNPETCVVRAALYAYDDEMADGIEEGLKNVTDDKGNWNGFKSYWDGSRGSNYYIRTGNKFEVIWKTAGYTNYDGYVDMIFGQPEAPENPEA